MDNLQNVPDGLDFPGSKFEQERLAALETHQILDTPGEEIFDRITMLTRGVLGVPMSMLSFIDGHRQWFKSHHGVDYCETPRGDSFCYHAVRERRPLIVSDASADARFRDNPFVCGPPHIRFYAGIPVKSSDGHFIGTLCAVDTVPRNFTAHQFQLVRELAELAGLALHLRRMATIDTLTKTLTRRAFCDEAARSLTLAQRQDYDLSFLVFDIDHLRQINDRHGRAAGDAVLIGTIDSCRSVLRSTDILGRLDGDEFGIVMPFTNKVGANILSEKLCAAISSNLVHVGGSKISVTASAGVVAASLDDDNAENLVTRANEAVHRAKSADSNRVQAAKPPTEGQSGNDRRVLKAGQIIFNSGKSVLDCTVRRLSDVGAEFQVSASVHVPEVFKLNIPADNFSRRCKVVRRSDKRMSVAFE